MESTPRLVAILGGVLFAVLLFAIPPAAHAQTADSLEMSGSAGPVSESARAVEANPSSMGTVEGIELNLDHSLHLRSQTFETGGDDAESFVLQSNPGVSFVSDLGTDRFRVGFNGALPRRYGSDWPSDGPQRFDSIFHRVRDIHLTAAGSFSPVDWLHLGGSLRLIQAEYRSYRAADLAPVVARQEGADRDSVPRRDPGNEGREFLGFNGRTLGWSAGATVTPGPFRVGAAFHSPVALELDGTYELYIPRNEYYRDRYGGDINRDATLRTRWPARIDVGLAYEFGGESEVFGHVGWANWSSVDDIEVDVEEPEGARSFDRREALELRDSFEVRLGGVFGVGDGLAVDGTIGFDTSPIPSGALTARVLDTPKVLAGAGVRWPLADGVDLRGGYQHLYHLPQSTDPADGESGTAGDYSQNVGMVESSISVRLP